MFACLRLLLRVRLSASVAACLPQVPVRALAANGQPSGERVAMVVDIVFRNGALKITGFDMDNHIVYVLASLRIEFIHRANQHSLWVPPRRIQHRRSCGFLVVLLLSLSTAMPTRMRAC